MKITCQSFSSLLQSRRTVFNERFSIARRLYPDLDAAAFTQFLTDVLDPLAAQVERLDPGALPLFVETAYQIGLELSGKKLIGQGSHSSVHENLWRIIFPSIVTLLLKEPVSLLPKLSNAAHLIDKELHSGVDDWLLSIEQIGPACQDGDALLALAQVSAWKCGMAHFRKSAIPLLTKIPSQSCNSLFGTTGIIDWQEEIVQLLADPWYSPMFKSGKKTPPMHRQTGGFRGFGGPFICPPVAIDYEENLLLFCNNEWWVVHADIFGETCKRLLKDNTATFPSQNVSGQQVFKSGVAIIDNVVSYQGQTFTFAQGDRVSGVAVVSNTMIVTFANSHVVHIFEVHKNDSCF